MANSIEIHHITPHTQITASLMANENKYFRNWVMRVGEVRSRAGNGKKNIVGWIDGGKSQIRWINKPKIIWYIGNENRMNDDINEILWPTGI